MLEATHEPLKFSEGLVENEKYLHVSFYRGSLENSIVRDNLEWREDWCRPLNKCPHDPAWSWFICHNPAMAYTEVVLFRSSPFHVMLYSVSRIESNVVFLETLPTKRDICCLSVCLTLCQSIWLSVNWHNLSGRANRVGGIWYKPTWLTETHF